MVYLSRGICSTSDWSGLNNDDDDEDDDNDGDDDDGDDYKQRHNVLTYWTFRLIKRLIVFRTSEKTKFILFAHNIVQQ